MLNLRYLLTLNQRRNKMKVWNQGGSNDDPKNLQPVEDTEQDKMSKAEMVDAAQDMEDRMNEEGGIPPSPVGSSGEESPLDDESFEGLADDESDEGCIDNPGEEDEDTRSEAAQAGFRLVLEEKGRKQLWTLWQDMLAIATIANKKTADKLAETLQLTDFSLPTDFMKSTNQTPPFAITLAPVPKDKSARKSPKGTQRATGKLGAIVKTPKKSNKVNAYRSTSLRKTQNSIQRGLKKAGFKNGKRPR
jgi:hypothetical protein